MSDYLGNLLARSFAPTLEVRPKVGSRFEPSRTNPIFAQSNDLELEAEGLAVSSPPPSAAAIRTGPVPRAGEPNSSGLKTSSLEVENPFPSATITGHSQPAAISAKKSHLTALQPRVTAQGADSPPMELEAPPSITRARHFADPAPVPQEDAQSDPRPYPLLPANATTERDSEPNHLRGKRTFSEATTKPGVTVRPAIPAREAISDQARSPRQKMIQHEPPAATPPTIQVTIGRVEVRATTNSSMPRAPVKKVPAMTLDTYLQNRAEGGRR